MPGGKAGSMKPGELKEERTGERRDGRTEIRKNGILAGAFRISKRGGECLLATIVLTQRGAKPSFPSFFYYVNKKFWSNFGQSVMADLAKKFENLKI